MARPGRFAGRTPIETAIDAALQAELVRARVAERHSTHPAAIAAQERRRIARLAQATRQRNEADRRRAHRLDLEASMLRAGDGAC